MVLGCVGKAKGQTLDRGEHHGRPKVAQLQGVWFLVLSVTFSFLSKQRMCMYIGAGYKAED